MSLQPMNNAFVSSSKPTHRRINDGVDGVFLNIPGLPELDLSQFTPLRPDATMLQIRVFLSRQGINPDSVPAILDGLYPDGPERWEARSRWAVAQRVPFGHPLVAEIAGQLNLTPDDVWDQILATE